MQAKVDECRMQHKKKMTEDSHAGISYCILIIPKNLRRQKQGNSNILSIRMPSVNALKRLSSWLCVGFLVLLVFVILAYFSEVDQPPKWYMETVPCAISPQKMDQMKQMLHLINYTMIQNLNAPYFLCFGTLWGAMRSTELLPWDNNIDVCVLEHDLSGLSNSDISTAFAQVGISVSYSRMNGMYSLKYRSAVGYITVFRQGSTDLNFRTGLAAYFYPSIYYDPMFPSWLTDKPLPFKDFLGSRYPVPHGEFEIMMYFYPNNWWRIMKPSGC